MQARLLHQAKLQHILTRGEIAQPASMAKRLMKLKQVKAMPSNYGTVHFKYGLCHLFYTPFVAKMKERREVQATYPNLT